MLHRRHPGTMLLRAAGRDEGLWPRHFVGVEQRMVPGGEGGDVLRRGVS
jgi:hypothetical protein